MLLFCIREGFGNDGLLGIEVCLIIDFSFWFFGVIKIYLLFGLVDVGVVWFVLEILCLELVDLIGSGILFLIEIFRLVNFWY